MFYICQVDQLNGGTFARENPASGRISSDTYRGKGPNVPINMNFVFTLYKSSHRLSQQGGIESPTIVFAEAGSSDTTTWYYPPSDIGRAQRDADYAYIMKYEGEKCPHDVGPSAKA